MLKSICLNLGKSLLEELPVKRIDNREQEVALNVLLALVREVWEVAHYLLVVLDAMQYAFDCQFRTNRHAHSSDLMEQKVFPSPCKDLPDKFQRAVAQTWQEYLTYICQ